MADRTDVPTTPGGAKLVPWTDGERAANARLITHFAGCQVCKGGKAVCGVGTSLLAELKVANAAAREEATRA